MRSTTASVEDRASSASCAEAVFERRVMIYNNPTEDQVTA